MIPFNTLHLLQYMKGLLTSGQILAFYPSQNATTLAAAVAYRKRTFPIVG